MALRANKGPSQKELEKYLVFQLLLHLWAVSMKLVRPLPRDWIPLPSLKSWLVCSPSGQ